jgi:branched-chain amino acid transport system substrate-binding protein
VRHQLLGKALAAAAAGALVLSGCGSNQTESGGDGGAAKKTATIGLSAPLSGDLTAIGVGIKNSVQLAIDQANKANKIPGWQLKLDAGDDQATPAVGAQLASKFASTKDVVGVIGTLNSSVAKQEIPILSKANVTMISPANTNPSLTQGENFDTAKARPVKTYFRVCTTDAIQGPFAAQYLYNVAGKKKVALINDGKTYGAGLVEQFKKEYVKLGGTVVADEKVSDKQKDFNALVGKVKGLAPEAVYFGGEYPAGGLLTKQMKQNGLNVPVMGGDAVNSAEYIKIAGTGSDGDFSTSVGAPTETLDSAKAFLDGYKAAGFAEPYDTYGAYAYDAANVLIEAAAKALAGKSSVDEGVKQAIVDGVQATNTTGATGAVAFDEFGDTTNRVLTVYAVKGGKWAAEKTDTFK